MSKRLSKVQTIPVQMDCYNGDEWGDFISGFIDDFSGRKRTVDLNALACSECDLLYQRDMLRAGKCQPADWAVTPLARAFRDPNDEQRTKLMPLRRFNGK